MKRKVAIVTDGAADFPPQMAEELGIILTPLYVIWGTESLRDKIDLSAEQFVRRLETEPKLPTTSGSNVQDMVEAYDKALQVADSVVSIHVATELSVTMKSATQAREMMKDKDITVIDSRSVIGGQGLPVLAAAKAANAGASKEEVINLVNSIIAKTNTLLTVETLKYFLAGGRITVTQAFLANLLGLHPIIRIGDGKIAPFGRERGRTRCLSKMLKTMEEEVGGRGAKVYAMIHHLRVPDQAQDLKKTLQERFDCQDEVHIFELGAATGTHGGPGTLAFSYYPV